MAKTQRYTYPTTAELCEELLPTLGSIKWRRGRRNGRRRKKKPSEKRRVHTTDFEAEERIDA